MSETTIDEPGREPGAGGPGGAAGRSRAGGARDWAGGAAGRAGRRLEGPRLASGRPCAKDNKAKADEAEERAIKTEAELEKARLVTRIAQETGVPAGLIHGESAEELEASAKAAAEWAASLAPAYPSDKGGSATAPDGHPRVHRRNRRPDCEDPRPGGERRPIPIARRQHART